MNTYLVSIPHEKGLTHFVSQSATSKLIGRAGIIDKIWYCGVGYTHEWRVKCTEDQLLVLTLLGATVKNNLTEMYKNSGLAKLTPDEKEALGLS